MNKSIFTNQDFCYWLQGYFEITVKPVLNQYRIQQISEKLDIITEPLGDYTHWLFCVLSYIEDNDYDSLIIQQYQPHIMENLNLIFLHVIDNSYDTDKDNEYLLDVHDGIIKG